MMEDPLYNKFLEKDTVSLQITPWGLKKSLVKLLYKPVPGKFKSKSTEVASYHMKILDSEDLLC